MKQVYIIWYKEMLSCNPELQNYIGLFRHDSKETKYLISILKSHPCLKFLEWWLLANLLKSKVIEVLLVSETFWYLEETISLRKKGGGPQSIIRLESYTIKS